MATKTSFDEETVTKVIRQVEFYFSDSNLPRDNFLRSTISEDEDGMVSLALICSFRRMKTHLALGGDVKADGIPEDTVNAVADILRTSESLKISEDGKKVGRKFELAKPEEIIEHVNNRTVAVSPLAYDVKLEDVESFFTKFGKVNSVRLPKHVSNKNVFCGTALVEFSTEEDAEKLLKLTLAYDGADLEFKPKKDFDAEREKQADESDKTQLLGKRKGSEEANYIKGLIIAFKLNSKSSGGDSKQNGAQEHVSEVEAPKTEGSSVVDASEGASMASENAEKGPEEITDNASNSNEEVKEGEVDEKSTDIVDKNGEKAVEGKSTRESYKDNMDVVIREDLKAVFEKFGKVKFIDFNMGEESGYIRFEEPEGSQKARAAAVLNEEGGLLVKNYIATLEPVSGEAEKKYWSQIQENQKAHYKGHHRGGRGGRFNRGGGRHGRSRDNHSPAGRHNKAQRV